jgi:hypothetical protein
MDIACSILRIGDRSPWGNVGQIRYPSESNKKKEWYEERLWDQRENKPDVHKFGE